MFRLKASHIELRRALPLIVGILLFIILVSYAPVSDIQNAFKRFDTSYLLALLGLSLLYYGLKSVRFWYLLQALGIHQPFKVVAISYMCAQPISLIPGGEIYRSHSLRKYTGVPVRESIGQFTMQGFIEGAALATLAVISALALHTLREPMILLAAILLLLTIVISRGYVTQAGAFLNKLPYINVAHETYAKLDEHQRAILSWQWLPFLYGVSIVIEIVGAVIAYVAVLSVGSQIDGYQAMLLYAIPVIAGFVSFVPGGIGVSEQAAVGVLVLSNVSIGAAVAATLIMRSTIVILGVLYGLLCNVYANKKLTVVKNI